MMLNTVARTVTGSLEITLGMASRVLEELLVNSHRRCLVVQSKEFEAVMRTCAIVDAHIKLSRVQLAVRRKSFCALGKSRLVHHRGCRAPSHYKKDLPRLSECGELRGPEGSRAKKLLRAFCNSIKRPPSDPREQVIYRKLSSNSEGENT